MEEPAITIFKIREVIELNNKINKNNKFSDINKTSINIADDIEKALQPMSNDEKVLFDYLNSLHITEIIDLCALMDFGRDYCQKGTSELLTTKIKSCRNNLANESVSHLANYLLGKGRNLSLYLTKALKHI